MSKDVLNSNDLQPEAEHEQTAVPDTPEPAATSAAPAESDEFKAGKDL